MRQGAIRYAQAGEHDIAFREYVGDDGGDHDIVVVNRMHFPMDALPLDPPARRLLEGLAGLGRLIVFDRRGIGLSDPLTDWETPLYDQWADDLAAVIDATACRHPTVFSWDHPPVARACSVRHPGLIARLVLFNPGSWTGADDELRAVVAEGIEGLGAKQRAGDDYEFSHAPERAKDPAYREWLIAAIRAAASPSFFGQAAKHVRTAGSRLFDDRSVDTPTLVITRMPDGYLPKEFMHRAAELIPGARHVDLGDGDAVPWSRVDDVLAVVSEFVSGEAHLPPPQRHVAVILFTDLVDSTRRAASAGDADWKLLLDRHDAMNRNEVTRCGGEVIKTTGDGVLALLPSATAAIDAATGIRDRLAADHLEVRVGIHVGEIDRRGDDVSGLAVHIAARAMSSADAGQILCTAVVAQLAGSGSFQRVGERSFKGVEGTWDLYVPTSDHPALA